MELSAVSVSGVVSCVNLERTLCGRHISEYNYEKYIHYFTTAVYVRNFLSFKLQ